MVIIQNLTIPLFLHMPFEISLNFGNSINGGDHKQ